MDIEQKQAELIEQFVHRAENLRGGSLSNVIVEATSHPSLFAFSEILSVPSVAELQGTEYSVYLDVLRLFAYGTWSDYKSNAGSLPPLQPDQVLKLKQLSVLTLAETDKVLPYDQLMQQLDVSNVRELEDFLINECMYTGIVRGKLDQLRRCFEVQFAAGRDLRPEQIGKTALKLDTLIGDVEDAVSSSMTSNLKRVSSAPNSEESRLNAIKYLKETEDILTYITKSRPQWSRLISAVDHRVDRALAILRPQAIADHRNLLTSLGWPPPLSNTTFVNSKTQKSSELLNPLFIMQGDLKSKYCVNFLALCSLQELQGRRKSRQLEGHNLEVALHQPLWAIEELVNPISLASQRHFSKWVEKPEFIFALVYKTTREFVDSMDEILQPLIDKARLAGYSCREEWMSAMVTSLSTYLAKEIFPKYVSQVEDSVTGDPSQARASWLHLVDLMIAFDKRIQSLITNSGVLLSVREDENLQRISSLSVFCDRPDWLEMWAELELRDAVDKLKPLLEDDKSWKNRIQGGILLSGIEDYKSPAISGSFLQCLSLVIERCRPLPSISLRARFIRLAAAPIVLEFIDCLIRGCQEAEGLTALADDEALVKVINSINASRYCESVLKEWCEDVFFIEMGSDGTHNAQRSNDNSAEDPGSSVFEEEIGKLNEFQAEWVEKLSTVVLRGFDARCRDYFKNKKQWQEKGDVGYVSRAFVGALDYLQGKISRLEEDLNEIDFVGVWRSLAGGVDLLVFNGVLMSNSKFHDGGVERFGGDLEVLFGVFGAWCLRPEGFFPRVSEGLRLLKMEKQQVKGSETGKESWLRENGIRHLTVAETEKILKNRIFIG